MDVQPRHRVASAPHALDAQTVFLYSGARVLCPAVRSVPVLRRSARLAGHRSGAQRADLHRRFAGAVQRAGHVAARGARQASRRIRGRGRRNLFPAQQRVGMAENPALRCAQLCDGHLPQRRAGSAELRHLPDCARAGQLHHHGGFPEPARKHLQLPRCARQKLRPPDGPQLPRGGVRFFPFPADFRPAGYGHHPCRLFHHRRALSPAHRAASRVSGFHSLLRRGHGARAVGTDLHGDRSV